MSIWPNVRVRNASLCGNAATIVAQLLRYYSRSYLHKGPLIAMPLIDACIPAGALSSGAEATLIEELTSILIGHEGLGPANERTRSSTWVFLHRPVTYRAGIPTTTPLYRILPTVPEGQYTDAAREGLVRDGTAAIARAEGKADFDEVASRVWSSRLKCSTVVGAAAVLSGVCPKSWNISAATRDRNSGAWRSSARGQAQEGLCRIAGGPRFWRSRPSL